MAGIDRDALLQLCYELTAIPSPTGEEHAAATFAAAAMRGYGLDAEVQEAEHGVANAVGTLGAGDGPSLMLWAPLDTPFSDGPEDADWIGADPRADWALPPQRDGSTVIGLGADNPKAFATCAIAAAASVAADGVPLRGKLVVGLAGGTMPLSRRPGLGTGTRRLLRDDTPDFCVVLKPGYAAVHEEVGFAWYRIRVPGDLGYTGIRHKTGGTNAVVSAARAVDAIERWLADYTPANSSELVAPQGSVNAIRAGDLGVGSFPPACAELLLDLRIAPGGSAESARSELEETLAEYGASVEIVASVPPARTSPDSWIVRSVVRAWEACEGRPHTLPKATSGASDAGLIRAAGAETVRIGLPPPEAPGPFAGFSMGVANGDSMLRLTELLVKVIVDTATRTREEVGLA